MVSIRDVAKLAGVSPATVSRAINGSAKVEEEKKARIFKVIEETGFRPNEVARALYKKSSKMIGMIVPNIENPFISEIAKAAEKEAFKHGYRMMLSNSGENSKKELESIQMLETMNADGIIIMTNNESVYDNVQDFKIPIVTLDRQMGVGNEIAWLQADHYKGAKIATEHLIECGCKNIVNMRGLQKYSSARERYEGYLDVCKENGLEPKYVECEYKLEDGLQEAYELIEKYPNVDGILAANDMVAIALYKVLSKKGYNVPNDIQIVGFDNIDLSWLFTPEITTVSQPIKEMGKTATKIIINNVEGRKFKKENIFDVILVKRDTTIPKK